MVKSNLLGTIDYIKDKLDILEEIYDNSSEENLTYDYLDRKSRLEMALIHINEEIEYNREEMKTYEIRIRSTK